MSRFSYRISDTLHVTSYGEDAGTVSPKNTAVFLALFKGGKGRYGAWSPFVDWSAK